MSPWYKAFGPESWSNWALVAVGVAGILTALSTLFAIRKQTSALVESQRPKIAAAPHGNPVQDLSERRNPRVRIAVSNRGASVAHNLIYESWIELLPEPFTSFTNGADYHKSQEPVALYPDHEPFIINIPIRKGISDLQYEAVRKLKLFACVRVQVTYNDAFSSERRSNFGFRVEPDGLGFLPKYNTAD